MKAGEDEAGEMITLKEAAGWLNEMRPSELGPANRLSINQMMDETLDKVKIREKILQDLLSVNLNHRGNEEALEVLFQVAIQYAVWEDWRNAISVLQRVVEGYHPGSHRRGVVHWTLGIALYDQLEERSAHDHWMQARKLFADRAVAELRAENFRASTWYQSILLRMRIDCACHVQEACLHWLTSTHWPSTLTSLSMNLVRQLEKEICAKKYPKVYETANRLSQLAVNRLRVGETPEALMMIGLAISEMQNYEKAEEFFTHARSLYEPVSHGAVIARWALGNIYWQTTAKYEQAIKSWRDALEMTEELRRREDHQHNDEKMNWYRSTGDVMTDALDQMMRAKGIIS